MLVYLKSIPLQYTAVTCTSKEHVTVAIRLFLTLVFGKHLKLQRDCQLATASFFCHINAPIPTHSNSLHKLLDYLRVSCDTA